jgi:hypothetical protein
VSMLFARRRKAWSQPPFWAATDDSWSPLLGSTPGRETIPHSFEAYVGRAFKRSGPVAACVAARMYVFSEATFQFRRRQNGRPTEPFGDPALQLLETPWPGATTGDLLARMELDGQLAGNSIQTLADNRGRLGRTASGPGLRIARLRPDWVTIIIGSFSGDPHAADAQVIAYEYQPRPMAGTPRQPDPVLLLPEETAHYSPLPDPDAMHRGMSWLTPVLEEIQADQATTRHKRKFLDRGASPKITVTLPREASEDEVRRFKALMKQQHEGVEHAYKTLFLTGGADVKTVGADLKQLDFRATQGVGETRICAAARVHPVIAGLSEGLSGSSLNAGNFSAARRLFVEGTLSPLWRMAAGALQRLVTPPEGAQLWADTRDIPFLREDSRDLAEIQDIQARAIANLVRDGFKADAAVAFVQGDNLAALLGAHTGLFSVQLQPAGAGTEPQPQPGGQAA